MHVKTSGLSAEEVTGCAGVWVTWWRYFQVGSLLDIGSSWPRVKRRHQGRELSLQDKVIVPSPPATSFGLVLLLLLQDGDRWRARPHLPTPSMEKQCKNSRAALPGPPRTPGPPDCHLRSRRRRRPALGGLLHRPALPAACWRDSCPESLGVVKENGKYDSI